MTSVEFVDAPDSPIQSEQGEQVEFTDKDIFGWLATLPEEYIVCRLVNHAWRLPFGYHDATVNTNGNPKTPRKVKEMRLVCERCDAEKLLRIKTTSKRIVRDVAPPPILYPDDYLAPVGMVVPKVKVLEFVARRAGEGGGFSK